MTSRQGACSLVERPRSPPWSGRSGRGLHPGPLLNAEGKSVSLDYMGESCRDADLATAETEVFLDLSRQAAARGTNCSVSLDLSHIGSVVDRELRLANAIRLAEPTAAAAGQEMMISMEDPVRLFQALADAAQHCDHPASDQMTGAE